MTKKILVTGGAGFIGFHLIQKLNSTRHEVVAVDNFDPYYSIALKKARATAIQKMNVSMMVLDIRNGHALEQLIKKEKPTTIVHLAAQAGVRYSLEKPQQYIDVNIQGLLNLLEAMRRNPQITLVYASSSSVYGNNQKLPSSEEEKGLKPANLYGITKLTNELMAQAYHAMFGIKAVGLRFFTVYGPWGRPDMAYFLFAKAIQKGTTIQLYNNGLMQRDFTYIDDIVDGIIAAIHQGVGGEVFNLGTGVSTRIDFLVHYLEEALQKKARINRVSKHAADILITCADITKSKKLLGYNPKVSLRQGLSHFVEWYKKNSFLA